MKKIIIGIIIFISVIQNSFSHKLVIDSNLNDVNNMGVYNEYNIIKPHISPTILESIYNVDYDATEENLKKLGVSNTTCDITSSNKINKHCVRVEKAYNDVNNTNVNVEAYYDTGLFFYDKNYNNSEKSTMQIAQGFVNHSNGVDTYWYPTLMSLNVHQKQGLELGKVYLNQTYVEIMGNQSNAILNFRSMGNNINYTKSDTYRFNAMDKTMQMLWRAENLYSIDFYGSTLANYLRGSAIRADKNMGGTSFASPRIMGFATNVVANFNNFSLHQIKQILLTTATPVNKEGYLDNLYGWGTVNEEKALKGPAQFNAGLLDEEALYAGNADKIYDNKGNTYFYADVPEDEEYVFSNDITSGLTGDSYKGAKNKRIYKNYLHTALYWKKDFAKSLDIDENHPKANKDLINHDEKIFYLHITDVIPSEYRMYKDRAEAGLRKAGLGTLILEGKQLYNAPTQVLEGTLILSNESNSTYEVVEDANLYILGNDIHIKEIKLSGNLVLGGKNIKIDKLTRTKTSKLHIIKDSKKIVVDIYTRPTDKAFSKLPSKDIFYAKRIINEDVEFEDIFINPNKTIKLPYINLEDNIDLDIVGTKLRDLTGLEKFNLLQYDDKNNKFEDGVSTIDSEPYQRYLNLKSKGFYNPIPNKITESTYENGKLIKVKEYFEEIPAFRNVSYSDVIFDFYGLQAIKFNMRNETFESPYYIYQKKH